MSPAELAHLFSLTNEYRSIKYDLRNMELLMRKLGNPERSFRSVLIAGTNGKGSVASFLAAMRPGAGLYTSPHLDRLNERIRIGGQEISDQDLGEIHAEVARAAEGADLLYPATYFELVTAIAFVYFRGRTDFAVLEVGMGGRLDATNVVRQQVSVITSIGLDHREFLGSTLEEIAGEKAGIIKDREPVVIGSTADFAVVRQRARGRLLRSADAEVEALSLGDGFFELAVRTAAGRHERLRPKIAGRHQVENAVVAVLAAEALGIFPDDIRSGIDSARWPGRIEKVEGAPPILIDGAHNPAAVKTLCAFLGEFHPAGVSMIFACMADKQYVEMLDMLRPHVTTATFTRTGGERAKDPFELQRLWPGSQVAASAADAIALLRKSSRDPILVCGSLYLVGEARHVLGLDPVPATGC